MLVKLLKKNIFKFARVCGSASQAIEGMKSGDLVLAGGFGLCGIPMNLINAVK